MITIYHNPRCRKSRETLAIIQESGEDFQIVEYLKTPLNQKELKALLHKLKMQPDELLRKGESLWKEKFKGKTLGEDQILTAMAEHPKLMERPVVVKGQSAILGRPPENVRGFLEHAHGN
ncbi:MAG: arsenate reductase (glutaredoxin) [Robiginitalea sp.]|uniref:arsenate reductase (glutaredoxin) n=1 Tax=Robiginitalea sp. TaxID=1902411 RepID=UPI003C72F6B6